MIQRIKKSLFVFSAILSGILYPFISSAGWVDNLQKGIGTYILFLVIKLAVNIAKFFTKLSGSLLNWVLSPNFISYSYTNPGGPNANPIIETGLGITQGFVNMILVLILVYIAIATILRLAGHETKKLLITFIIVALLVNFAPVICGLIVDASNIVMNFFIQDLKADAFGATMARSVEEISAGFDERTEIQSAWPFITQLAVMVPFLWVLTFILLLFTVIFILRYLVIWLLVILSPLAFACYILPMTRKYFDMWWKQFINWSFIGVTCGFFLYLGLLLVTKIQDGGAVSIPSTAGDAVFNGILPYFVSAIFLGIGLVFGLQTSAIGASTVVNFAKTRGRASIKTTGRSAKWLAREGVMKIGRGIRPDIERPVRRAVAGTARFLGRIGNWGIPGMRKVKPFAFAKWATPEKFREFGNLRPTIEKAAKEAEAESGLESADKILTQKVKGAKGTGLLYKLLKTNDAQDLFNRARKFRRWKNLSDEKLLKNKGFREIIAPLLKSAEDSGMTGTILRRDPRLAKIAAAYKIRGYAGLSDAMAVSKATGEAREHIKDWEPEELNDKDQMRSVLAKFEEDRMIKLTNVKNGQSTMLDSMDDDFSEFARKHSTIKGSGFSESEIEELLSDRVDKDGKKTESETFKEVWKDYEEETEKLYGGSAGFRALESKRVIERGYRKARFKKEKPKKEKKEKKKPLTPGEGMGADPSGFSGPGV